MKTAAYFYKLDNDCSKGIHVYRRWLTTTDKSTARSIFARLHKINALPGEVCFFCNNKNI